METGEYCLMLVGCFTVGWHVAGVCMYLIKKLMS